MARRVFRTSLAGTAIDAGRLGVVSYLRSSGAGVTLNRGDETPGTDSGRQVPSCEQHSSDFASRSVLTHGAYDACFHPRMTDQFALLQSDRCLRIEL